ncbi:hypothetical protein ACQP3F_33730, partial [Escherichia coli]
KGVRHQSLAQFYYYFVVVVFLDKVSLCSPGCPDTHSVAHDALNSEQPASASQVLQSKAYAITAHLILPI